MLEPTPTPKDILPDSNARVERQAGSRFKLGEMLSQTRTILAGLWNGIPVELAFIVPPETRNAILEEFHRKADSQPIKQKVKIMLGLLEKHFPKLQPHSLQWMSVRAYFFGEVELWGKFG